ncbi:hypothetical protein Q7P37_009878 [Cladosporium fusiforme]
MGVWAPLPHPFDLCGGDARLCEEESVDMERLVFGVFIRQVPRGHVDISHKLTIKQVVALAWWSLLYDGLRAGLGKTLSPPDGDEKAALAQQYFASQAPLIVSVGTTRCSTALVINELLRMIQGRWRRVSLASTCLIGLWTLGAPLIAMVKCAPVEPRGIWMCPGETPRRVTSTTIDVLIEVWLGVLPSAICWKVQMARSEKWKVTIAFSWRLAVAGLTVGRCLAYGEYVDHGRASIDLAPTLVWDASMVFSAILTASVPVLLHMLRDLSTAHLLTTNHSRSGRGSAHQLSTLESGTGGKMRAGVDDGDAVGEDDFKLGDDGHSVSATTTPQSGRPSLQGSEVAILPHD